MSFNVERIAALASFLFLIASLASAEKGRIYGKIHTDRDDVLQGVIRWDKNEASWDDFLDGNKVKSDHSEISHRRKYGDEKREISIFGIAIFSEGGSWGGVSQSGVAFGHIRKLTAAGSDEVELLLKSGEEVTFRSGSTDFGDGMRELVIETEDQGELELDWSDIDYIEFMDGGDVKSDFGRRIYGTVVTSRGGEFSGWIAWDADEMFYTDVIDGEESGHKRKIKFSQIASIERMSSQASLVVTREGQKIRLDGSNDIDSGNRGIVVSDRKLGRVSIPWDEFEELQIKEPPTDAYVRYDDFDGGRRISGTVYDEDGNQYSGYIRWDNDEEYTWETLDGSYRGVEFNIPFENIRIIEKHSSGSTQVTLWDGRRFILRDSNDVDDSNNGIFIISRDKKSGDETELDWDSFDHLELEKK